MILGKCYWRLDKIKLDKFLSSIMERYAVNGELAQTIFCHPSIVNEVKEIVKINVMPAPININGFILSGSEYDNTTRV